MTAEATRGRVLGGKKPSGTEELDFASAPQGYVISYVSSDTGVFSGTILENLTLGLESFTDEDVEKVCEITKIDEILDDVPGAGFGLKVEESGANLSSGQKQRIAIARALLRNPQLLILDEATANLDPRMESEILQEIAKQRPDMAILMITHRLSSMKCYDRIIYLQDGRTTGEGNHEELQDNCEAYRKFMADEKYTPLKFAGRTWDRIQT